MIRFERELRRLTIGVRDLIYLDAGPLRAEPGLALRARAGSRAHRERRRQGEERREGYQGERPIEHAFERRGYRVVVQGRIDGLYREDGRWVVEEVKSVILDPARLGDGLSRLVLEEGAYAEYRQQLELYVFFLAEALRAEAVTPDAGRQAPAVLGRLVFVNLAGRAATSDLPLLDAGERDSSATVEVVPDLEAVRAWVVERVDVVLDRLEAEEAAREARRRAAASIVFPFPSPRLHQDELIDEVRAALAEGQHLLVSAPTGVGKTAAVLFAALRHALAEGLQIVYVTSKTTQRRIVAETLERMARATVAELPTGADAGFRAVQLRAREKVCPNLAEAGFIRCHEDFCRYARRYREKVDGGGLLQRLLATPVALPDTAVALGREAEACPYQLGLEAALEADVIIGDYNHVFDPRSHLRAFFQERRHRDAVLVIDEAHNLYARGRESFSPALQRRDASALLRWAREGAEDPALPSEAAEARRAAAAWCRRVDALFAAASAHGRDELGDPPVFPIELDPAVLESLTEELDEARTLDLVARRFTQPGARAAGRRARRGEASSRGAGLDPLGDAAERWSAFVSAHEALEGTPHLTLYDKSDAAGHRLRLLCLDPSGPLGRRLAGFRSAIALSATLEPLEFYRDVLGFPAARTRTAVIPSPFPPENRKVLVWDRVSTYFRSRSRDAAEVARLVLEVADVEPGNYLACFSSYGYLREVAAHLGPEAEGRCIVQTPGMSEEDRDRVLAALREPGSRRILLAVQGGIFTEGVDYPGSMLIGAIVVGPGLPAVGFDEERVREHFDDRFGQGFEYAYLFPGMNRVVQCAGRVIRSETDVGVIVLVGERFSQGQYARLFPQDWYRSTPRELVTRDLRGDLERFWAEARARGGAGGGPAANG